MKSLFNKFFCVALGLALATGAWAQEPDDGSSLPEIYTPDTDSTLSDEAVARLQAITGIHRLVKMAADDNELREKMYLDPRGALAQAGVQLADELEIEVAKDEDAGGAKFTTRGGEFTNTQVFNEKGEYDLSGTVEGVEKQEKKTDMQPRGATSEAMAACCFDSVYCQSPRYHSLYECPARATYTSPYSGTKYYYWSGSYYCQSIDTYTGDMAILACWDDDSHFK